MDSKIIYVFILVFLIPLSLLNAQEGVERQLHFESDQHELSESAISQLDELIALTDNATSYTFYVKGHTDQDGSNAYNEHLSHKRSRAVRDYLLNKGISEENMELSFYGERQLIDARETDQAKAGNRRVEVRLQLISIESVEEMYAHFARKRTQHFTIDSGAESKLKAKDGTIVKIPANAFQHPDGRSLEGATIDFKIEEAIRPSAMVFNQLNTVHGENALSTGGMIRLTASVDGVPLKLKDGKALDVFVPVSDPNPDMNLYSGQRDTEGRMEWELLEEPVNIVGSAAVHAEPLPFPKEILTAFDQLEIDIPEHPGKLKELPLPALLKKPEPMTEKMDRPYKPGIPHKQLASKPKGLFAKLKYDPVEAQRKLDEQYEKRMQQYQNRVIQYELAMKAYKENEKVYKAELAEIDKQYIKDNGVVIAKRVELIYDYMERCYAFEAALRLNRKIDEFQEDLSAATIHDKLYPDPAEKKPPMYFFNYSLVAAIYMARGEQMPRWEDSYYAEYRTKVSVAADQLATKTGYLDAFRKVKKTYKNWQNENALLLKKQNYQEYARLDEQIQYYGFKITDPDPFWCNIDTPIPMGSELIVFENQGFVEMYTFCMAQKSVNYFPMDMKKSALYRSGETVSYIAFQFLNNQMQLAKGMVKPNKRSSVVLDFKPSSLAAVEQAILALDL